MIIVDLNQIMISNMCQMIGTNYAADISEDMFRHMVLNSLRAYRQKFCADSGEMVIACDSGTYWRKDIFPYYKANRVTAKAKSPINWKLVHQHIDTIKAELKEYFPYRIIDVPKAEADDIIGVLATRYGKEQDVMILSADFDFVQLHTNERVTQFDPIRKRQIKHPAPDLYMKEHIIRGDRGDGIPNILSADDCLVMKVRQKPLTKKNFDWLMLNNKQCCAQETQVLWERNERLIDLSKTPEYIADEVVRQYEAQAGKGRKNLIDYFIKHRLKNLMANLNDF